MDGQMSTAERASGRAVIRTERAKKWQVVTIFAIGRFLKADVMRLCAATYLRRPSELSARQADEFIERLKRMRPATAAAGF